MYHTLTTRHTHARIHTYRNYYTQIETVCVVKRWRLRLQWMNDWINFGLLANYPVHDATKIMFSEHSFDMSSNIKWSKKCNPNAHLRILWSVDLKVAETEDKSQTGKYSSDTVYCICPLIDCISKRIFLESSVFFAYFFFVAFTQRWICIKVSSSSCE